VDRPRVIVTRRLPESVEARAAELFDVALNSTDEPFATADLAEAMRAADGVLVTVTDRIDAAVLAAQPRRARIVANFGVGFDHIDLAAAAERGIVVTNTPGVLTDDTADLTMALLLAVMRRVGEGERHVRSGAWTGWRPTHMLGTRVTGATLGIVGMGRIGRAVAARAQHGFGMRIRYFQPRPVDPATLAGVSAIRCETLDQLLATCDIVSLHCPATAQTRHLIDEARLRLMRPGSVLINTARGGIVDEAALARALAAGALSGAGLDVYEREPEVARGLTELENVVLLPHLGSATVHARRAMGDRAIDNLVAFFDGRDVPDRLA
jgi:lactate dehydrogenase-like 2-hydroxyacid dehydrogenase